MIAWLNDPQPAAWEVHGAWGLFLALVVAMMIGLVALAM